MDRAKGIGGTEIGAIIGVNPWKNAMQVYLDKVGLSGEIPDNEAMFWGREMEPVLRKRYMKESGHEVFYPGHCAHPLYPWYIGTPDDLVDAHMIQEGIFVAQGGVDYKTTGHRNDYGAPGSDEVPEWVATQMHWYMGLTGAAWWDVAVLFFSPRREFHIFPLKRNQEIIDNLTEAGRDFWESHVIPQIPPPLDASEASKKLLNYLYPRDVDDLFAADAEIERLAKLLQTLEVARDKAVEDLTVVQNLLKQDIGDHAGVVTSLGKVTWKRTKDREVVDWKAAYDAACRELITLMTPDEYEVFAKRSIQYNTKATPGSRVFRAWWKKEDS